ncbi:chemotaxis protein CheW [Candidatus Sumerlaeota bacterium]|nr:chemotaxis protein CheW [Candidatus Sumerlaeota bacterium]
MSFADDEIMQEFVTEALEHLGDVQNQLLTIEEQGADFDRGVVDTVFRAMHTIKGAAGMLGLETINRLAHQLEDVLNRIRGGDLIPTSEVVDALLQGSDVLNGMVSDIDNSADVDISGPLGLLAAVMECEGPQSAESAEPEGESATEEETPVEEVPPESTDEASAETEPEEKSAAEPKAAPAKSGEAPSPREGGEAPVETSLRVNVMLIEQLMRLAGELVLSRNQLLQAVTSMDTMALQKTSQHVDLITSELQGVIMCTRLQPIGKVFSKFPRVVRDLSKSMRKKVNLDVQGSEVELDKTIIEAIGDPLTHLIRNSLDHGIETPAERLAKGKPETGQVKLNAYHEAGQVCIQIMDDGAGIDPERLKQKAIEKGMFTLDRLEEMPTREIFNLIFHPGFSTAKRVTDVSGRGVGMDVVKTNLTRIGGVIDLQSEVDKGTTVTVKLPLTLAIIPSLIVRAGKDRFAIPQVNVSELVRICAEDVGKRIEQVHGAEVLRLRGSLLPLVRLRRLLWDEPMYYDPVTQEARPDRRLRDADRRSGQPVTEEIREKRTGETDRRHSVVSAMNIIVVTAGSIQFGMIVDSLSDSEEIVVKALGRHLKRCNCFAGSTIMGDGQVALILDVAGVAKRADLLRVGEKLEKAAAEAWEDAEGEKISILLFNNAESETFAVPLGLVSRIEKIGKDEAEIVNDRRVLQYRGKSVPLISLERHISAKPRVEGADYFVIVFEIRGRELGLISSKIQDVREVLAQFDAATFRERGISGSLILDGVTVRLIEIFELAELAEPSLFKAQGPQVVADGTDPKVILLAEDSGFFRRHIKEQMEEVGYVVLDAEDGQAAWELLLENLPRIDVVVTDIEMPILNGLEFTRRIREDERTAHLPVVALSTLAGEGDIERGYRAGVNDYQIKLDRDRLFAAIATQISGGGAGKCAQR